MVICVHMTHIIRPHWYSKEGIFQILLSGLWLALSCYGFYHIYFYRLGRYGNDKLGMLGFLFVGVFSLISIIQLLFVRALIFDGKSVRIRSIFSTKNIPIRDITKVWWEIPRIGVMDLLMRKSNWRRVFKATIGFDGSKQVLCEQNIGRGWNRVELKNFCRYVNEQIAIQK